MFHALFKLLKNFPAKYARKWLGENAFYILTQILI
jgi:hypothetical protein